MIKLIYDGLSIVDGNVVYDKEHDNENDIMNTVDPSIYKSEFGNNVYYFGYAFKDSASRKDRTAVIHWLKGIGDSVIDEKSLISFIDKPIRYFDREVKLSDIGCIAYPRSGRSQLTNYIIKELNRFAQHDTIKTSIEFIKNIPQNVYFDWDSFEADCGDDENKFKQAKDYIENTLLPKIHNLDYFSIADSVKPRYRQYIRDYLTIDEKSEKVIESIEDNGNILIVDDINTTGATLDEIIRIIRKINNKCSIYIFTLIGKE